MKIIFLLSNFSGTSKKAIEEFIRVYHPVVHEDVNYVLLNAWEQPRTGHFQLINLEEHMEQTSVIDLEKQKNELETLFPDFSLPLSLISQKGEITTVLNYLAETQHPELVVLGSKGSNVIREILFSTTGRIVRKANAPVLIIPETTPFTRPERILFATDMKECSNQEDFQKLTDIVRQFMAELMILHIYKKDKPDTENFEQCMMKHLHGINHAFYYKQHVDTAAGITEFALNMNAGLLAMVLHDSSLLANLFQHTLTRKLTHKASLPILVIHE